MPTVIAKVEELRVFPSSLDAMKGTKDTVGSSPNYPFRFSDIYSPGIHSPKKEGAVSYLQTVNMLLTGI